MPVKIIGGFPCSNFGCWNVEAKTDCEYYWINFGVVLVEEITNYLCGNCKCLPMQVINHREEKFDKTRLKRKISKEVYGSTAYKSRDKVPLLPKRHNRENHNL